MVSKIAIYRQNPFLRVNSNIIVLFFTNPLITHAMMKYISTLIWAIFAILPVSAQGVADTLRARLEEQYYENPQEKVHLTTDRNHYMGGDTIWFRGFVVSAATHEPVKVSKYLYVELRTPYNTVDQRIKVIERDGVYAGYVPLDMRVPEGDYTIVAYTNFMNSAGEAYFFKKPVGVRNAYSLRTDLSADFEWEDDGNRLVCRIDYRDRTTEEELEREFTYRTVKDRDWKPSWRRKGTETVKLDREEYLAGYLLVMCDDYAKYIRLPRSNAGYDVTFHPEGGYMVPGEECRVAFKAIDSYGLGIPVSGTVTDSLGREVARFGSLHAGMGSFSFTPVAGMRYRAECKALRTGEAGTFELPAVNADAAVVCADIIGDSIIDIGIKGNCPGDAVVAVQERGLLVYAGKPGRHRELRVECDSLSAGVLQVLLLDGGMRPLSERLLFVMTGRGDSARITPSRPSYGNREKITLDISLDGYTSPAGSVAVAVTDNKFGDERGTSNILTNLLLQSELRGYIENPAFYFERDDSLCRRALDALMMTQGWRRYDIPASLRGEYQYPSAAIEKSQQISGTVKSLWRGKPLADATVKLLSKKIGFARSVKTDSLGRFCFNGFDNPGGVTYELEAVNKNGDTESNVEIDPEVFPTVAAIDAKTDYDRPAEFQVSTQYDTAERMRLSASGTYNIILNELVVEGHKSNLENKDISEMLAYRSFDEDYMEDRGYTTIEEAVRSIAGLRITPDGDMIYRNRPVGVVVDGVPFGVGGMIGTGDPSVLQMEDKITSMRRKNVFGDVAKASQAAVQRTLSYNVGSTSMSGGVLNELDNLYPFQMIKRIDFLQSGAALIYGNFPGGALVITMKEGFVEEDHKQYGIKNLSPLGYQQYVEFYSPKYLMASGNITEGNDIRNTVYWSPNISINDNGKTVIEFYANDNPSTTYNVVIEGMTNSGKFIHASQKLDKR